MLPHVAQLKSGSGGRSRWGLALLGLAVLLLPTWDESVQSQEAAGQQFTKPYESSAMEIKTEKGTISPAFTGRTSRTKEVARSPKVPTLEADDHAAEIPSSGKRPAVITRRNQQVKTLSAPPEIEYHPQPSAAAQQILDELSQPVALELNNESLGAVFGLLAQKYQINVVVDALALKKENVAIESAHVTLKVVDVSLRSTLKLILDSANLGFYLDDEVLKITTKSDLQGTQSKRRTTRTYPVGDLISNDDDLESLSAAIQEIVVTDGEIGGWGELNRIAKVPNLGTLIIRQSEAGHHEVLHLLRSLRQTKGEAEKGRFGGGGGGFF